MTHPKLVGELSTLAIMRALRAAGYTLALPFGENVRYDLVVDDGRRLARVQCKTGRLHAGTVVFKTCSSYRHHANPRTPERHYQGEIDFFAVYCPQTDSVYLVPIDDIPSRSKGVLRVDEPRNGQQKGIRFAADYEISRVQVTAGPGGRAGDSGSCA